MLVLMRLAEARVLHHPVIQRAVIFKLQRAKRVRDALNGISQRMGVIIHRVDAPFAARAVMFLIEDSVHRRVAHIDVGGRHVDPGAQDVAPLGKLASPHPAEQVKALFGWPVAPWAVFAGLRQRASVFAHLVGAQFIHIGQAARDEIFRDQVTLLIILACVVQTARPVKAKPADIIHNTFDVLGFFLGRICIVKAQIAKPAVFFGGTEVCHQRLAVSDMQMAVGLGRKAGMHLGAAAAFEVLIDGVPDKVCTLLAFRHALAPFVFWGILYRFYKLSTRLRTL